jgi:hypothetical protein
MKKFLVVAALLSAMQVAVASAEGIPSKSKLSQLGLNSMNVVDDQVGHEVRGKFLGVGGILNLGASNTGTVLGGAVAFPGIAAMTHISGNAPRALGNTAFAASGFATVSTATTGGNPTFTGYTNVPFVVSVADVTGTGQIGIQFFTMTAGN